MRIKPHDHYPPGTKVSPALVFDSGILTIKQQGYGDEDGDGSLAFSEENVEWEQQEDSSECYLVVRVCRSDLLHVRDHLNELFPPEMIKRED